MGLVKARWNVSGDRETLYGFRYLCRVPTAIKTRDGKRVRNSTIIIMDIDITKSPILYGEGLTSEAIQVRGWNIVQYEHWRVDPGIPWPRFTATKVA